MAEGDVRMTRMALSVAIAAILAAAAPVQAQNNAAPLTVPVTPNWSPEKVTAAVAKICTIPRIYIVVTRGYDGSARLQQSPSVTREQHACATHAIDKMGVPFRH